MSDARPVWEPKVAGFLCNWCSYAGADLAGVSRIQYPSNLRIIRVMCSARVDPCIVLKAFSLGVDAVMVVGCHLGDCHYATGNYQTEQRMKEVRKIIQEVGLSPNRLLVDWVSAAEGQRFATMVTEFVNQVKAFGPLGSETHLEKAELALRLTAAANTFQEQKVRWLVGKERELLQEGNVYGEKVEQEALDEVINQLLKREYGKNRILIELAERPLSIAELAARTGTSDRHILRQLVEMEKEGLVSVVEAEGDSPRYSVIQGGEGPSADVGGGD